jgi:hypothetical protein
MSDLIDAAGDAWDRAAEAISVGTESDEEVAAETARVVAERARTAAAAAKAKADADASAGHSMGLWTGIAIGAGMLALIGIAVLVVRK